MPNNSRLVLLNHSSLLSRCPLLEENLTSQLPEDCTLKIVSGKIGGDSDECTILVIPNKPDCSTVPPLLKIVNASNIPD